MDGLIKFTCRRCHGPAVADCRQRSGFCWPCGMAHRAEGMRATTHVTNAINRGALKRAREHICADCGKQARDWDHRDYLRPLDVVPLCKGCNVRRGSAFDSVMRPAGEVERPQPYIHVDRRKTWRAERQSALAQPA